MLILFFFILAIVVGMIYYKSTGPHEYSSGKPPMGFIKSVGMGILVIVLGFLQPIAITIIEAGNVGVKVSLLGNDRGVGKYEYISGVVFYNKYTARVQEISLTQQHVEYETLDAVTYGGLPVKITPKFNYSVKAGNAGDMYVNLRKPLNEIEAQWLATSVLAAVNDVTNRWKIDSILTHRELFEADITRDANKKVGKWFTLSQLRTNLVPPVSLIKSIQEKTKAAQDIQVAESRKLVAMAEGITRRETAKADSAVKVIAAAGEARANNLKQVSLTPNLLEWRKIEAWEKGGSQVPTYVSGSANGMIFNMK